MRYGPQKGPSLSVETDSGEPWPFSGEHRLLRDWLNLVAPEEAASFPLDLHADRWVAPVPHDLGTSEFTFVGDDLRWCAQGLIDGHEVRLTATGWGHEGLRLSRVRPSDVCRNEDPALPWVAHRLRHDDDHDRGGPGPGVAPRRRLGCA